EAHRIGEHAVLVDLEVQVASRNLHAAAPDRPDHLAGPHDLPHLDGERVEMEVAGAHAARVQDAHEEAAGAERAPAPATDLPGQEAARHHPAARHVRPREHHHAVGDGAHRLADGGVDVQAVVLALAV